MRDRAWPSNDLEVSVSDPPLPASGPTPKRNMRGRLVALATIVILIVGMFAWLGPKAWLIVNQQGKIISAPEAVGALSRQANTGSASVFADVLRQHGVHDPIAAAYAAAEQRPASPDATSIDVYFAAGSGLIWAPEVLLDKLLTVLADAAMTGRAMSLRQASLNSDGGLVKCATLNSGPNLGYLACGWADHGSIGVIFIDHSPLGFDAAIELTQQFRAAALTPRA